MSAERRTPAEQLPPAELAERLLRLTTSLTSILTRETEALQARKIGALGELQAEKIRVANDYAMDSQAVRQRTALIDRAPSEKINELKAAMHDLDETLRRNEETLLATKSVSDRLIHAVAEAVSRQKAPAGGYGENAAIRQTRSRDNSIAFDERA